MTDDQLPAWVQALIDRRRQEAERRREHDDRRFYGLVERRNARLARLAAREASTEEER